MPPDAPARARAVVAAEDVREPRPGRRVLRPTCSAACSRSCRAVPSAVPDRPAARVGGVCLGFVHLHMPAAGITTSALGLPLLFLLYLRATGLGHRRLPSAAGAGCWRSARSRVAWVVVGGGLVAQSYGVPMGVGLAFHHLVGAGFAIPAAGHTPDDRAGHRRACYVGHRVRRSTGSPSVPWAHWRSAPPPPRDPAGSAVRRGTCCRQPPTGRAAGRSAALCPDDR